MQSYRYLRSRALAEQKGIELRAVKNSMYTFEQIYPNTATNHLTAARELIGDLKIPILEKAIQALIQRHQALRSKFVEVEGEARQCFVREFKSTSDWPLKIIDATELKTKPDLEDMLNTLKKFKADKIATEPFDLKEGPLFRIVLIRLPNNCYQLLFVFHHIIIDGDSQKILMRDLASIYNAMLDEKKEELPSPPALSEIKAVNENLEEKKSYWQKKLDGMQQLPLQAEFPRSIDLEESKDKPKQKFQGDRLRFSFNAQSVEMLESLAKEHNVTIHMFLLASLYVLSQRLTGEDDICVGTVSRNRHPGSYNVDVSNVVDCLINSIALRFCFNGKFVDLLQYVKKETTLAYQHQRPIDEVVQHAVKTPLNIAAPFNILFVSNNVEPDPGFKNVKTTPSVQLNLKNTKVENCGINLDKFPDGSMQGFVEYNSALFSEAYFENFLSRWYTLLKSIIENPHADISDLQFIPEKERDFLAKVNETQRKNPFTGFFHEIFSSTAAEIPDQKAITFLAKDGKKVSLTYHELDEQSTQLAAFLANAGCGPKKRVGICLSRSINFIIVLFAIYKSGATAVPLDDEASEALYYKVKDCRLNVIIVDNKTKNLFPDEVFKNGFKLNIDDAATLKKIYKELRPVYHAPDLSLDDIAQIYYTTGSTGVPKGVRVKHRGLANLANALYQLLDIEFQVKTFGTAPFTADAFLFEPILALINRGQFHFCENTSVDILNVCNEEKIDAAAFYSEVFKSLDPRKSHSLSKVITMGDPPSAQAVKCWMRKRDVTVGNGFGPTEASVGITTTPFVIDEKETPLTNIGLPFPNCQIFVVDKNGKYECPTFVPGEFWIAGDCLADGYIDPEKTKEKFKTLLFDPAERRFYNPDEMKLDDTEIESRKLKRIKIYKTGDLGYRQSNGTLVWLERMDRQVKVNGFRIELSTPEYLLRRHPDIANAVVELTPQKTLIASVEPKHPGRKFTRQELTEFLAHPMMVISAVRNVKIPLNKTGKIDRKKLSEIPPDLDSSLAQPKNEQQVYLRKLWAEVIGIPVETIGIDNKFKAHLGGKSIGWMRIMSRVIQEYAIKDAEIKKQLYVLYHEDPTIESFAQFLNKIMGKNVKVISVGSASSGSASSGSSSERKNPSHKRKAPKEDKSESDATEKYTSRIQPRRPFFNQEMSKRKTNTERNVSSSDTTTLKMP